MDQLAAVVPFVATCSSIGLTLSPLPAVLKMVERGSPGAMQVFPLVSMVANNFINVAFGVELHDDTVVLVAALNGLLSIFYVSAYYSTADPSQQRRLRSALVLLHILLTAALGAVASVAPDEAAHWIGLLSCTGGVILFASPLAGLRGVVRRRSVEGMSLPLSVMSAVCSSTWAVYGLQQSNQFIYLPNAIGSLLSFGQLSLFALFPATKSGPKDDADIDPALGPDDDRPSTV